MQWRWFIAIKKKIFTFFKTNFFYPHSSNVPLLPWLLLFFSGLKKFVTFIIEMVCFFFDYFGFCLASDMNDISQYPVCLFTFWFFTGINPSMFVSFLWLLYRFWFGCSCKPEMKGETIFFRWRILWFDIV